MKRHKLPGILKLFKELSQKETGLQYIESLLRYLLSNMENMTGDKLKSIVCESVTGKEGSVIMEYADSVLGKEFHRGMQQGILQGLKESAFDLINVRFGPGQVAESIKQLIKTMDETAQLKALKEKIKTASSVAEIKAFAGN